MGSLRLKPAFGPTRKAATIQIGASPATYYDVIQGITDEKILMDCNVSDTLGRLYLR